MIRLFTATFTPAILLVCSGIRLEVEAARVTLHGTIWKRPEFDGFLASAKLPEWIEPFQSWAVASAADLPQRLRAELDAAQACCMDQVFWSEPGSALRMISDAMGPAYLHYFGTPTDRVNYAAAWTLRWLRDHPVAAVVAGAAAGAFVADVGRRWYEGKSRPHLEGKDEESRAKAAVMKVSNGDADRRAVSKFEDIDDLLVSGARIALLRASLLGWCQLKSGRLSLALHAAQMPPPYIPWKDMVRVRKSLIRTLISSSNASAITNGLIGLEPLAARCNGTTVMYLAWEDTRRLLLQLVAADIVPRFAPQQPEPALAPVPAVSAAEKLGTAFRVSA
eukprot:TRINITY_DN33679_c0_g1_i1.p1 TRINITY_DN33679_c0_g1~~TRINITY_DN33679_c0_g1_i1.p1  ORF type:complete len:335 (+),score=48.57 TRINITY_DN33679_c0_g1_i1:39-1043(+)